jgi:glycosyltransferase involved in cell wall biosynthesis
VLLIDHVAGGGAERFVVDLAGSLVSRNLHVTVCVSRGEADPTAVASLRARGVDLLLLGRTSRLQLHRWLPLLQLLRAGRVDVLNTHLHGSNVYGSFLSLASGTPLIATEHGWAFEGQPLRRLLDRVVVGTRADAIVAVSEHQRDRLLRFVGVPDRKLRVIVPSSQESPTPLPSRAEALALLGVPDDGSHLVGTVCSLRRPKRLDVLLEAFTTLARRRRVRLAIVGDGPERLGVEAWARRLAPGLAVLTGWRDDVAEILSAFDVFALSSDVEGTPLALIEAMRARRAIVATAVGGVPEAAPDGECALLVPPGDPAALGTAIERLLDNPALAARLGDRAGRRARERYRFDRAADAWLDLLTTVATTHRLARQETT